MICCYCDVSLSCAACGHEMPEDMGIVALDSATKWKASHDALVKALAKISEQKTSDEHIAEYGEYFVGDYEEGYDALVKIARGALAFVGSAGAP